MWEEVFNDEGQKPIGRYYYYYYWEKRKSSMVSYKISFFILKLFLKNYSMEVIITKILKIFLN